MADPELKTTTMSLQAHCCTYNAVQLKADVGYDQQENQGYRGLSLLCISVHLTDSVYCQI